MIAAAVGIMSAAATGCSSSSASSSGSSSIPGPKLTLKFGAIQNVNTPTTDSAQQFAKLVSKYTDGKLTVTVYPNAELGQISAELSGTEAGTVSFLAAPDLSAVVPQSDVLEMPYLFPSAAVASKVLSSAAIKKSLWSLFPSHGLTYIGTWVLGYTAILTKSKPINTVSDLKGLKIRIFAPSVQDPVFSALGADGVSVNGPEVLTALTTGVVDGADDPTSTMVGSNWYSGMCCVALTNDAFITSPVMMSTKIWDRLSSAEQAAIERAFNATVASNLTSAAAANTAALATMERAGVKVTKPSAAAFKAATQKVYAQIERLYPGQLQALQAEIKAVSGG